MKKPDTEFTLEISRRKLLAAAGIGGGVAVAASLIGTGEAQGALPAPRSFDPVATPPVAGLHLQFGADASSEMVVSWHTLQPVRNPCLVLGHLDGKLEQKVEAKAVSYTDAKSGQVVYAYHAELAGLQADFPYLYAATHDGAEPEFATFRTSPRGRAPFTFTSFGDQGTPTLGKKFVPPIGVTLPKIPYVNDNLGSPAAGDTTLGVERLQPLFHLFNGDLCYANLAEDRVRTWWDFWENNSRSARKRPWMPSPGNHENELGNGPIGYQAYQTYFSVPEAAGQTEVTRGLWYAFTAGSVRVISIANDDIVYQEAAIPMFGAIQPALRRPGWKRNWLRRVPISMSTGSSYACIRSPFRRPTNSTARTSEFARNGCLCSISTALISWCAGMSITTSARTRSAAGNQMPR
jgi:hypothetical protein